MGTQALPRIVYHWTSEKNFKGIIENGLKIPDGDNITINHGSSFGVGIYVATDCRYGEEFFSYGASQAFMCLSLPGKQIFGKPPPSFEGFGRRDGWDSVHAREGQRGMDEWVFYRTDQLLTCFLVDKLGMDAGKDTLYTAIRILQQPWPDIPNAAVHAEIDNAGKISFDQPEDFTDLHFSRGNVNDQSKELTESNGMHDTSHPCEPFLTSAAQPPSQRWIRRLQDVHCDSNLSQDTTAQSFSVRRWHRKTPASKNLG